MKNNNALSILLSILIGLFVFFVGVEVRSEGTPNEVYKVYLNGQVIGLINSKEELLNLIDERQQSIKEKYNVSKVYPPNGLDIKEEYTFSNDISDAEAIYNLIQDKDPFTVKGYTITIKYPNEEVGSEDGTIKKRATKIINVLNKSDFEEAFRTVIKAFIGSSEYEMYVTDTQPEIVDVGRRIETIYWEENITIKENNISIESEILTNENDISKYLFFGTIEKQEEYVIKEGDDITSISAAHNLNTEEFLVANPSFTSKNVLLTPGQKVNVGLIDPLVTIVSEVHLVEDVVKKYEVEYIDDEKSYLGNEKVIQEGTNGMSRETEKILYKNGEIHQLVIVDGLSQELSPVINKIISRGTKAYSNGNQFYTNPLGNDSWSWPTISPFVITSRFKPRWGSHHNAIDISGTGYGSPIRAVQAGTVVRNVYSSSYGHYIIINHNNGYLTLYAHLAKRAIPEVGATVAREEVIGYMGNSGFSTGTHLHLEVIPGSSYVYGNWLDPCNSIFNC